MNAAKNMTEAQLVADAILEQLGARRFMVMTGARELVATAKGLQFRLPAGQAKDGINMVRVELDGETDTYTVIVGRWQRLDFAEKARAELVYCDRLAATFQALTGLYTRL